MFMLQAKVTCSVCRWIISLNVVDIIKLTLINVTQMSAEKTYGVLKWSKDPGHQLNPVLDTVSDSGCAFWNCDHPPHFFLTVKCHSPLSRLASIKAACTTGHCSHSRHVHLHDWIKIQRRPAQLAGRVIWSGTSSPLSWHLEVCNGHAWVRYSMFFSKLQSVMAKDETKARVKVSMDVLAFIHFG